MFKSRNIILDCPIAIINGWSHGRILNQEGKGKGLVEFKEHLRLPCLLLIGWSSDYNFQADGFVLYTSFVHLFSLVGLEVWRLLERGSNSLMQVFVMGIKD